VIDPRDTAILHSIGVWMQQNGESIYGTTASPLPLQPWGESTRKGNRLYLHVFQWPKQAPLYVGGLTGNVSKAWLLTDARQQALPLTRINDKDVNIQVPAIAPDTMNSVIVLEMEKMLTDSIRVLGTTLRNPNVLLAFDGTLHGGGLKYGDGKAPRYYVFDWTRQEQHVSWTFRVPEGGARCAVHIKYAADATTCSNTFTVKAGGQTLKGKTQALASRKGETVVRQELGVLRLPPGVHTLEIRPENIHGKELMKLFEITLTPIIYKEEM
jgi:hypothetical protein